MGEAAFATQLAAAGYRVLKGFGKGSGSKIAGFDMDWTLIRTKSGKTFAQNRDDWELWHPSLLQCACPHASPDATEPREHAHRPGAMCAS
eukprot:gene36608-62322_t